jgi:hypothetical protein
MLAFAKLTPARVPSDSCSEPDFLTLNSEFLSNRNLLSDVHVYSVRVKVFSGYMLEHLLMFRHPLFEMAASAHYFS